MFKRFFIVAVIVFVAGWIIYFEIDKHTQEQLRAYRPQYVLQKDPRESIEGEWEKHPCPENTIAGFDFSEKSGRIEAESLFKIYGEGCVDVHNEAESGHHRYYDADSNTYIDLVIDDSRLVNVLLTSNQISKQTCVAKTKFNMLMTGKGIKVGDSEELVKKAYGTPSISRPWQYQKGDLKPGLMAWRYLSFEVLVSSQGITRPISPFNHLEIIINKGRVNAIELGD